MSDLSEAALFGDSPITNIEPLNSKLSVYKTGGGVKTKTKTSYGGGNMNFELGLGGPTQTISKTSSYKSPAFGGNFDGSMNFDFGSASPTKTVVKTTSYTGGSNFDPSMNFGQIGPTKTVVKTTSYKSGGIPSNYDGIFSTLNTAINQPHAEAYKLISSNVGNFGSYGGGVKTNYKLQYPTHEPPSRSSDCPGFPKAPDNANIRCAQLSGICKATCNDDDYQFPNGQTDLSISCVDGEWTIKGTELDTIPSCERKNFLLFKNLNVLI